MAPATFAVLQKNAGDKLQQAERFMRAGLPKTVFPFPARGPPAIASEQILICIVWCSLRLGGEPLFAVPSLQVPEHQ